MADGNVHRQWPASQHRRVSFRWKNEIAPRPPDIDPPGIRGSRLCHILLGAPDPPCPGTDRPGCRTAGAGAARPRRRIDGDHAVRGLAGGQDRLPTVVRHRRLCNRSHSPDAGDRADRPHAVRDLVCPGRGAGPHQLRSQPPRHLYRACAGPPTDVGFPRLLQCRLHLRRRDDEPAHGNWRRPPICRSLWSPPSSCWAS